MSANGTTTVESGNNKLATLRARKKEREEKAALEFEAIEIQALELEEKYVAEGKTLGVDFAVEITAIGAFAVRKPEFIVAKRFADAETKTVEDVVQFVSPCMLFPEQAQARSIFIEHGGIAYALAAKLMKMYQADASAKRGK